MQDRATRWNWIVIALLAFGCGVGSTDSPVNPADTSEFPTLPAVTPVAAELPSVVAHVNSHSITREELERAVRSAEIQAGQALPTQFRDQVYRSVLDRLISFHLLVQEAEALDISVTESTIEAALETIRSSFPTTDAFETQLESWNTTIEILRDETRRDLLAEATLEAQAFAGIEVTPEAVRGFYDQHTEQFAEKGGIRARHILIGVSLDAQESERLDARDRAEAIRKELSDGGDFAELARKHSEDAKSAANGGDLGLVAEGETLPQFDAALSALDPGEVSEVVETTFGFHIIQMVERVEDRVVAFAEASTQIHGFLLQQEYQMRVSSFIDELKSRSNIEILI
tara:strand:+ start:176 stop:1204 length:1029 start_codon:yes stop_codon:yes gene_type:complete